MRRMALRTGWGAARLARVLDIPQNVVEYNLVKLGLDTKEKRRRAQRDPTNGRFLKEW